MTERRASLSDDDVVVVDVANAVRDLHVDNELLAWPPCTAHLLRTNLDKSGTAFGFVLTGSVRSECR
jgi:hypothetical protein